MALLIRCPNCGSRPFTEFWFGGEIGPTPPVPGAPTDASAEFARVWWRHNVAGEQRERWFHYAGCRRWLTAQRDTRTNQMQPDPEAPGPAQRPTTGNHENGNAAG